MRDDVGVLFSEAVEGVPCYIVFATDRRDAFAAVHHPYDFDTIVDQLLQFRIASLAASEYDTLFAS